MDNGYTVRKAVEADSRRVWEIRNSPEARELSGSKETISFESHASWFEKKYFLTDENRCYVLVSGEEIIGYCRFDKKDDVYITSIALDPAYFGKGLGTFLLKEALSLFDIKGVIEASIRNDNASSIKLFEKAGFIHSGEKIGFRRYLLSK